MSINLSAAGPPMIKKIVGMMNNITGMVISAGSRLARSSKSVIWSLRISDRAHPQRLRERRSESHALRQHADNGPHARIVDTIRQVEQALACDRAGC